ncbi:DUF4230 domain-containing protein [Maribacter sp. PR1]|uniref:DUF4230 domain-containing protein n=1 Tax=Maribacter cobaltidurans TaxID=1178778 RepID=A0ABU7ITG3_9FLAO|nr:MULTISPECIES: DUF4230 domain-containing protein [Maribacter]MDC6388795.1 DUF4230 domain-containing protein [Maribacter sp. PR1]MEE1976184.1 DUF4230 domain-containing protein [Maribacter cobaltidurans]
MKRFIYGVLITLAVVFIVKSCGDENTSEAILEENSMLIQQQVENVSKLIVTEGHFAEVYNYRDSKELFGPLITAEKKALVVVNADVSISYDLSKVSFELDEDAKTLTIKSIPEPEIKLNPDFEYYDVTADYLNQFDAGDYNTIKRNVKNALLKKVEASTLRTNAKNRLLSELQKFYVLTNSLGWTLVYQDRNIESTTDFNILP